MEHDVLKNIQSILSALFNHSCSTVFRRPALRRRCLVACMKRDATHPSDLVYFRTQRACAVLSASEPSRQFASNDRLGCTTSACRTTSLHLSPHILGKMCNRQEPAHAILFPCGTLPFNTLLVFCVRCDLIDNYDCGGEEI